MAFSIPGQFTEFEAPGAGTSPHQGTFALGIDDAGDSVGMFVDNRFVYHGFSRTSTGFFTVIDDPKASTNGGTRAFGINASGEVTGTYFDQNYINHGFVRAPDATYTEFDLPNVETSSVPNSAPQFLGTVPINIDTAGNVSGT